MAMLASRMDGSVTIVLMMRVNRLELRLDRNTLELEKLQIRINRLERLLGLEARQARANVG